MVFSSPIFLMVFFPILFLVYYVLPNKYKNQWLILGSVFFYAWSGVKYLFLLLLSVIVNFFAGRLIEKTNHKKAVLTVAVIYDLAVLFFYKYSVFVAESILFFIPQHSVDEIPIINTLIMPIGISFYTFQILAYIIDVYNQKVIAQKSIGKLLLYISMFPQLIAGPIVRYSDVVEEIDNRTICREDVYLGLKRFIYGLGKKVLLADTLGEIVESVFAGNGTWVSWIGMITYSLQLYFDFSAYSDMAIGMGRMLGFHFLENFDNPYHSKSIQEFWRRWHISLSSWFRDYVYIPLGGNRKGTVSTYRNLFIVFFLTGLWHGASWNFVVWGLWHGCFSILERLGFNKILKKVPDFICRIYTLLIVGIGWLMFRTESIGANLSTICDLFRHRASNLGIFIGGLDTRLMISILASLILCIAGSDRILKSKLTSDIALLLVFVLVLLKISANQFSPFLYFRF